MRKILFLILLCTQLHAQQPAPYKIAIIGLVHAHVWGHLHSILQNKAVTLVGVAEPNPQLVQEANRLGIGMGLFYPDYTQMLDQTKPDIVWSFVENNRHLEIAKACAPRHINLIFEKPLASTYDDAKQISDLAHKYNIQIMTNYQMAWWPANYVARAAVQRGEVGTMYRLHGIVGHGGPSSEGVRNQVFFQWLTDPVKNGGGALMDFGCYNMLWSLWYMGMPQKVYATVNHLRPERFPKVEDNATIVLTYPNGVGIFEGSWDLPRSMQDLEVFGRPDGTTPGSLHMNQRGVELRQGRNQPQQLPLTPLPEDQTEPVTYMVSCMRQNKPIEGLTALAINLDVNYLIDLAQQSVKSGKAVELPK
ncbi:MAG TPA: Gfo/Idh/MocA family oxidoreductase [Bryobacteraceae bacterium]|jgi:predicted dehydrogenase|nr:Gfo/Idh/MocA family oxidoreductase [Bryobacteraceae bacterium]